ncbi:MAG: DUF962 domain-containing protein [Myxococcota bacterium]
MSETRIQSFAEFWPYYIGEHRLPVCRGLHYFGTTTAMATAIAAVVTATPLLWILVPLVGYGPAWIGHFFLEKNRPATFKYPLWSLMSDFKMLSLAARGKMGDEVVRLYGSRSPSANAPLLATR